MLEGTAADALRPYTPKKMKHLRIEETKAFKSLSFGTKWNLRDCLRHKSRSFMTLFGIVGCMILLVGGMGMKDTMDAFLDVFYEQAIHYRCRVNLDTESVTNAEACALAEELEGDWCAQRAVQIGDKGYSLEIYSVSRTRFASRTRICGSFPCRMKAPISADGLPGIITWDPATQLPFPRMTAMRNIRFP